LAVQTFSFARHPGRGAALAGAGARARPNAATAAIAYTHEYLCFKVFIVAPPL
jgi:hypothetical protein